MAIPSPPVAPYINTVSFSFRYSFLTIFHAVKYEIESVAACSSLISRGSGMIFVLGTVTNSA